MIRRLPLGWPARFILSATGMALLEEAVTTTMTNLAPFFGVPIGQAYITASANYLDVVLGHSVIVLVPMLLFGYGSFRVTISRPMRFSFCSG